MPFQEVLTIGRFRRASRTFARIGPFPRSEGRRWPRVTSAKRSASLAHQASSAASDGSSKTPHPCQDVARADAEQGGVEVDDDRLGPRARVEDPLEEEIAGRRLAAGKAPG